MMAMDRLAEAFDMPKDSPEHRWLRENSWLAGPAVQCRYYLGMLLGRNQFRQSAESFLRDLADFVTSRTSPQAMMFCGTEHHCQFVVDFLRRLFESQEGYSPSKEYTREHQALELLLTHPEWTDEQIAAEVEASRGALARWTTFQYARRCQRLYEQKAEGWYYPRPTAVTRRVAYGDRPGG